MIGTGGRTVTRQVYQPIVLNCWLDLPTVDCTDVRQRTSTCQPRPHAASGTDSRSPSDNINGTAMIIYSQCNTLALRHKVMVRSPRRSSKTPYLPTHPHTLTIVPTSTFSLFLFTSVSRRNPVALDDSTTRTTADAETRGGIV